MRRRILIGTFIVLLTLVGHRPGFGQEGHPLTGTWSGDWGPSATDRRHVTMVLNWDGTRITGTINPGASAVEIASAILDPATWTVRLEGDGKTAAGPAHIAIEGRIDDIGSAHRTLSGTWAEGSTRGAFKLTRD